MKMTGAQIIIETLIELGVTDVFGYPGGQAINIYEALYEKRDRIRHYLAAHEQGAAHAADGHFRASGKVGVVFATSGPGATNLVTGIATAMLDSVPMLAITGNVPRSLIGKDSFQEIDITGITLPITKHNYFINDIASLADSIREAYRIARSGRPGPVLIDVPKDIQMAQYDYEPQPIAPKFDNLHAAQADIALAAKMIDESERPYLYIGGGAIGAGIADEIAAFADKTDAVIGCSLMGISAVSTDCPRFLGMQGMHGRYASSMAQHNADLIVAIGVRFSDRATGNTAKYATKAKIIHIDIDFSEIRKNIGISLGIVGDVKDTFERIAALVQGGKRPKWMQFVDTLKETEASSAPQPDAMVPRNVLACINKAVTDDTVIATDVGQHQMWAAQYCRFNKTRKFVSSGGLGTMGFGMGAAIGAAVAAKERVVLITGDGSFGMNLNELATAVSYRTPLTIVLMNNGVLGMVRQWQTLFFKQHYSATTLGRKTDFVKLAEAFGAQGYRVSSIAEFEEVFQKAFAVDGPVLIECPIDKDEFVLPMLPPGGSMDDIITKAEVAK
ncbi:MAG: biosynthetic-type acetolactate synthase large subunit [Oscillospiraceae bacterium]|jgi:acetolactate synthase-1/2/3 large subunit|nr:biosynthetic-type acetolactate synthase large subunit [Oscillospiraceae bacterium]